MKMAINRESKLLVLAVPVLLSACGGGSYHPPVTLPEETVSAQPAFIASFTTTTYDGNQDDLLTAGLGKTGLGGAAPAFADPNNPTPAELRRNAIYNNYRAVLDINPLSGYGTLYGPNVDSSGNVTSGEGKIAGTEYLAYSSSATDPARAVLMVQVPTTFDPAHACIITGTSSGSRGIYGAIGSAGEWGLKKGCAVAYTDKGTGIGLYTFDDNGVNRLNGLHVARDAAGADVHFAPALADAARMSFAAAFPNRLAFKHAHSMQNPERDWGMYTLQSIEFAYFILNQKFGDLARDGKSHLAKLVPANTVVIASSISNGAGSALLAAEQDTKGLISGVAATEPQIQPRVSNTYTVEQGGAPVPAQGKALLDYSSFAALYQPCIAGSVLRCSALAGKGLLTGASLAAQQADALQRMHAYGWLPDSDVLQAAHASTNVLVAVTYAFAYGRFAVTDILCGFSFANTDALGNVVPFTTAQKAQGFANLNGIPGSVIYEPSVGGAKAYAFGVSPSTGLADQSLDGFLCLRSLVTGVDPVTGAALTGTRLANSQRVRAGMTEVLASGNLHGKPAVIAQGRSDALLPVNHASRAYLGFNAATEGSSSKLRYIEVTNANHFDVFTSVFPQSIVPLHVYLFRALDAVYANLSSGKALPASQVVRTVTRLNATTPMTAANLPPIATAVAAGDAITVNGTVVNVPN
jgi:hydroxybutyrate-dimer hydrolase